jgi:predicted regulator of Ras-like GTPase activity (Roadblock/LC7/MglB family)
MTVILEYARGLAIVSVLSAEAVLLVLARADANVGSLLFELRRNRQHISSLV